MHLGCMKILCFIFDIHIEKRYQRFFFRFLTFISVASGTICFVRRIYCIHLPCGFLFNLVKLHSYFSIWFEYKLFIWMSECLFKFRWKGIALFFLICMNNVNIDNNVKNKKTKNSKLHLWDSNPRHRSDWYLKPAP